MAYYDQAPKKRKPKTDYAARGDWDDEGSHYSGSKNRNQRDKNRYNGAGEHNPNKRQGGYNQGSSSSYRGEYRPSGRTGSGQRAWQKDDRRSAPRQNQRRYENREYENRESFAPEEPKGYRDYEYRAPAPVTARPVPEQEPQEAENLLVGRNPIREAIRSDRDMERLLVQRGELSGSAREIVMMAREAHIVVQEVDKSRLDAIAPHHQGMVAYVSAYTYSTVEDMLALAEERGEDPFLILLDEVTDPHNLGAVIRTAECAGAHGVILPARRSVGLTPAAVKASAGAVEHLKVAKVTNLNRTIEQLQARGIWTYALTMDGEDYRKVNYQGGVALVVGAEGEGISRLTLEKCDQRVSLPLRGKIDSLNASVAAGIMMYHILSVRQG